MTNTTPRVFSLNGSSLQEYRWNLRTIDGLYGRPAPRGENAAVPYLHGSFSHPHKFFNERFLVLRAAILPQDANGNVTFATPFDHLYDNKDDFLALFHDVNRELLSLKQVMPSGGEREILVEVQDEVFFTTENHDQIYIANVPLVAPSPFWRDIPVVSSGPHLIPDTWEQFNLVTGGNAPIHDMVITIDILTTTKNPVIWTWLSGDMIAVKQAAIPEANVENEAS